MRGEAWGDFVCVGGKVSYLRNSPDHQETFQLNLQSPTYYVLYLSKCVLINHACLVGRVGPVHSIRFCLVGLGTSGFMCFFFHSLLSLFYSTSYVDFRFCFLAL